jgi:hypothetical protein
MWVRIELEGRPPLFICECYFPHSSKTRKHRAAWNEVAERAQVYRELGLLVVMGDFNAHTDVNGGKMDTAAGC